VEKNLKKSSIRVLVVLAGSKFPHYELDRSMPQPGGAESLDLDLIA